MKRLADKGFRENRPAAASKAIFAKTIVLGHLHLPSLSVVERTELTPSRLLFVCEAQLQPRGTGTAISGTTPRTSRLPCTAPHAMSKCIFHPCRLCADSVILKVENSPYGKNDGDVCHSGLVTAIAEPWDNANGTRTAYITVSTCCESVTVTVRQTDEENFNWNYGELTNENRNLQRPRRS